MKASVTKLPVTKLIYNFSPAFQGAKTFFMNSACEYL
jgi:isocitrate lyase